MARRRRRRARPHPPAEDSRAGVIGWFARLPPVARGISAVVGTVATAVTTLLALGVISPAHSGEALANSVDKTLDAGTSNLAIRVASGRGAKATSFTAAGAFDYRAGRGRLRYDFSGTPGMEAATAVEAVFDNHVAYLHLPAGLGASRRRPWVRADLAVTDKLLRNAAQAGALPEAAPDFGALTNVDLADPSRTLDELRHAGAVKKLGSARLYGIDTTRYRGTIRPRRSERAAVIATVWIGPDQLVRRLVLSDAAGHGTVQTIDFSDFGTRVDVEPPSPETVVDLSDVLSNLIAG